MPFAIVLALLLVGVLAVVALSAVADDGPVMAADVPPPRLAVAPPRPAPLVRAVGNMVFAHAGDDGITLDCLVTTDGPGAVDRSARPRLVTLHLRRPATAWFSSCIEDVLRQWAAEDRVIEIGVRHDRGDRAELSDGRSRIVLDLDHLDGLAA